MSAAPRWILFVTVEGALLTPADGAGTLRAAGYARSFLTWAAHRSQVVVLPRGGIPTAVRLLSSW